MRSVGLAWGCNYWITTPSQSLSPDYGSVVFIVSKILHRPFASHPFYSFFSISHPPSVLCSLSFLAWLFGAPLLSPLFYYCWLLILINPNATLLLSGNLSFLLVLNIYMLQYNGCFGATRLRLHKFVCITFTVEHNITNGTKLRQTHSNHRRIAQENDLKNTFCFRYTLDIV